jgi:D-methionine transport system substrate-binding protein
MKKLFLVALITIFAVVTAACGQAAEKAPQADNNAKEAPSAVTLKVAATAVPHAEILEFVKPLLAKEGVNLEVKVFTDYILPNTQVFEKQMDANFFQHTPYLEQFNADNKMNLVTVTGVHIEPFGAYSKKITKIEDLKAGATVAIPNDPTNGGRALALLEKNGLIKMKDGVGVAGTVKDIVENKQNLQFKELEAAMLPRVLNDVEIALINTNYALEAQLVPTKDALLIEGSDSPYVNILVSRPDNKDSEAMQKLAKSLNSADVKKFIEDKYQGAVVPSFK